MTKWERNIAYSLPIFSICFEIAKSFLGSDFNLMAIRNYSIFIFIFYLIVKYFKYVIQLNVYLPLMLVYFLILLLTSDSNIEQYNDFVRLFDAKMLFPIGFIFTSSYEHLKSLNKRLLITTILFSISILIFSVFSIGKNQYGGDSGFKSGAFTFSAIYIGSFLLIILPVIYSDLKTKIAKNAVVVLGILTLVILILSVRRSALVIVIIGLATYMYLYRNELHKYILKGFAFLVILIMSFPLYKAPLMKQIEARGDVFNERGVTENLQEETRLEETKAVYYERILNPDLRILIFGEYLFDSAGRYDDGIHKQRPLHLDINVVLHGAGILGLLLFLLYVGQIFNKYVLLKTQLDPHYNRNLTAVFIGIYVSHLFLLISGGMITTTFNLITSLYLGAILGLYRSARLKTLQPLIDSTISDKSSVKEDYVTSYAKPYIYSSTSVNKSVN